MRDAAFVLTVFAVCFIGGCGKESPTNSLPPPDQSTLLLSRLSVSVVPGGSETIAICATDQGGSTDNCTITCSAPGVATATISDSTITITGVTYGTANVTVTSGSGMTRTIPVQVYNQYILDTGELFVTFIDSFTYLTGNYIRWYHPVVPEGFHALGSLVTYSNPVSSPDGKKAMMLVKAKNGSDALEWPVEYELLVRHETYLGPDPHNLFNGLWDIVGTWRPIPPDGYVALGCAVTGRRLSIPITSPLPDCQTPPLDYIVCVREDLTVDAEIGTEIWSDNVPRYGYWTIDQPDAGPHEYCYLVTGTIFGWDQDNPPAYSDVLHVLKVELPMLAEAPYQSYVPQLTSYEEPSPESAPMMAKAMLVPSTIVNDLQYSGNLRWRIANSPFYRLERYVFYKLLYHNHNTSSQPQTNSVTIRSGVTTTESSTFWTETGVSITREAGVNIEFVEGKVSTTVSLKFGYSTQTSVSELQETEYSTSVNTAPGTAAACWQKYNRYVLFRHNGVNFEEVYAWEFGIDSYLVDDYTGE